MNKIGSDMPVSAAEIGLRLSRFRGSLSSFGGEMAEWLKALVC